MPRPSPVTRRRARFVLALALAVAAGFGWYGRSLDTDNRVESWAEAVGEDPGYDILLDRFGGDFLVLVRVTDFDPRDARVAAWLDGLADRLAALPGAVRVLDGLSLMGQRSGTVAERLAQLDDRPLARAIGLGGTAPARLDTFVVIDAAAGPAESRAFDAGFQVLREEAEALPLELSAAGHPFMGAALDRESRSVDRVFAPLLVAVGLAVCSLLLRSLVLGFVTLLPGLVGALGTRAALVALGIPSNMILVAAGPLVFVVLVASMVHMAVAWRRATSAGVPPDVAARLARSRTLRPAFVAAVTTAAGFGVFATSDVSAVRELGVTVAIAVSTMVPLSYAVLPLVFAGLSCAAPPGTASGAVWRRAAVRAARARYGWWAATAALIALGLAAPFGMPVATNAIDYFRRGHPIRAEYERLDDESAGLSGLDLLVRVEGGIAPRAAAELTRAMEASPLVKAVFGPPDVFEDTAHVGPTAALLGPRLLVDMGRADPSGEWWRWTARSSLTTPEETHEFAAGLERVAREWSLAHGRDVHVAGSALRLHAMQEALVGTLATSLGLTALVALASFLVFLRGPRQWLTAIVANAVPVAAVLASARALGHALDAATVMVASAVVGLALDNTFHLLLAAGDGGRASPRARLRAFERVGSAVVAGIVVLAVGFACLAFADFLPTARFGLLASIGLLGALYADLVIIPALWVTGARRDPARRAVPIGLGLASGLLAAENRGSSHVPTHPDRQPR